MVIRSAAFAALLLAAGSASAVTIDGTIDTNEYASAIVTNVTQAPGVNIYTQGPGSPGANVENVGYSVYYMSDASNVYVALQSSGPTNNMTFANLYFDTNNSVSPGSDIGFEVLNNDAFVPSCCGTVFSVLTISQLGGFYATSTAQDGSATIEFSIPWTVFTTDAAGLGIPLVAPGGGLELRTSQSFNYAGATGDGEDLGATPRFGFQFAPEASVPEPASWAMFIGGFGLIGGAMRRKRMAISFS